MLLKTGFGYYVKNGRKLGKFELPLGNHPDPIGHDFIEVANKSELDKIKLDKSDEQLALEESVAQKELLRNSAIIKLKALGLTEEEIKAITL